MSVMEANLDVKKHDPPFDIASYLSGVSKRTGKKPGSQAVDIAKLAFGYGRLTAQEYYAFRLYDDDVYAFKDKQRFIGKRAQDRILTHLVPVDWWSVAHDKLVFYGLAAGLGFKVPIPHAVYHPYRRFGQCPLVRNREDLMQFLRSEAVYPFFGKPVNGMYSAGVTLATQYDPDTDQILLSGEERVSVESFATQLDPYFKDGYLFQERLQPHEKLREICGDCLSTFRMMLIVEDEGPKILHSLWKIPVGGNIADNFWRSGNLLAVVDTDSGRVNRAIQGTGPDQIECAKHPDSGQPLIGTTLPNWAEITELCLAGAASLPGLNMQAWDIALCSDGPVMVEVNVGGDFNLPQLATGRGLLDASFDKFLARHNLGPKRGIFR